MQQTAKGAAGAVGQMFPIGNIPGPGPVGGRKVAQIRHATIEEHRT